ncbi:OsmC family protein [Microbacterium sp. M]|uniref:OsmC family protein n=1 Tax=Microbacterium sp. M TaxID=3377125 RepID=UPI003866E825
MTDHIYTTGLDWSGSTGVGYRAYDRAHTVAINDEVTLSLSADSAFRGDARSANPEQLLLAAASSCQLLSFLAVAALAHVDIVRCTDSARAVMPADSSPMRITEVTLDVKIVARGTDEATVRALLQDAHEQCFIANSLAAPVTITAEVDIIA